MPCSQPRNHAPAAQRKRERLTAIEGAVELAAALVLRGRVKQPAGVMNDDDHARQRLVADAGDEVGDEHRGRRRRRGWGRRRRVRRLLRERVECHGSGRRGDKARERVPHPSTRGLRCHGVKIAAKGDRGDSPLRRTVFPEFSEGGCRRGRSPLRLRSALTARGRAGGGRGSRSPRARRTAGRCAPRRIQRSAERREWLAPFGPGTSGSAANAPRAFSAQVL